MLITGVTTIVHDWINDKKPHIKSLAIPFRTDGIYTREKKVRMSNLTTFYFTVKDSYFNDHSLDDIE